MSQPLKLSLYRREVGKETGPKNRRSLRPRKRRPKNFWRVLTKRMFLHQKGPQIQKRTKGVSKVSENLPFSWKPTLGAFFVFYLLACLLGRYGRCCRTDAPSPSLDFGDSGSLCGSYARVSSCPPEAWTFTVTEEEIRSDFHLFVGRSRSVPLEKATDVVARQGVVGKLLGFGTVRLTLLGSLFVGSKSGASGSPSRWRRQSGR